MICHYGGGARRHAAQGPAPAVWRRPGEPAGTVDFRNFIVLFLAETLAH